MRTFDYKHLPKNLFEGAVGDANVLLYEDKGKFDLLKRVRPDALDPLKRKAHADNVVSSLKIEGLYIDDSKLRAVIDGREPSGDMENQAAGYASALNRIECNSESMELTTATIIAFYEALYAHRGLGTKSRYRKKDYMYAQIDGHMQAVPVSPINAFETPLVLGGACDSLEGAFASGACSALILAGVFTVDFLCIRPFEEGNGRISRLFADLMLMKAGFDIARYSSIDRIIESSAMEYYDSLNACVEGWDRGRNDYKPFLTYWFGVLHEAYSEAFADIENGIGRAGKSGRVRTFVQHASGPVRKRDIIKALGDVSEATVENELGRMVKEGVAIKVGGGRSTAYEWVEES